MNNIKEMGEIVKNYNEVQQKVYKYKCMIQNIQDDKYYGMEPKNLVYTVGKPSIIDLLQKKLYALNKELSELKLYEVVRNGY